MTNLEQWLELIRKSPLMDEEWYTAIYQVENAAEHYLDEGWKHFYDPSAQFSTLSYLQDYPDVAEANIPPLIHYELYGRREGRVIRPIGVKMWQGRSKTGISRASYAPQSAWKPRMNVEDVYEVIRRADYLSFDVFDTLLLRNVERPTDLFRVMGVILKEPRFAQIRLEAEQECYRVIGVHANIHDIYERVVQRVSLDPKEGIQLELECEAKFCRPNPYMKQIFELAKAEHIPIVLVSDMYLPSEEIGRLLNNCGYSGWEKLYVSCEQGCAKGSGLLQKKVWKELGETKQVVHIGDNYRSDYLASEAIGWQSIHYKSCAEKSPEFYDTSEKTLTASIANAIYTNYLNNGAYRVTKEFEHGFLYGGILVCGFCQWLNKFSREHGIDQIWFLARDMDIVNQAYSRYYAEVDSCYVRASRCAVMELNVEEDPISFFNYHFYNRAFSGSVQIKQAFKEARLENLVDKLWECGLKPEQHLTFDNLDILRQFYMRHYKEVCEIFASTVEAAVAYFQRCLGEHKRICIADLGWNGTIMVELKRFLSRKNFPIDEVFCVMLGGNNNPITNDMITSEQMQTYLYSGVHEIGLALPDTTIQGNTQIMCLEAMFSADEPSLLRYDMGVNGEPVLVDGNSTALPWQISEIQCGILNFAEQFSKQMKKIPCMLDVSPKDAFSPYLTVADDFQYLYLLFESVKEYEDGMAVAGDKKRLTTLGNIIQSRGLI